MESALVPMFLFFLLAFVPGLVLAQGGDPVQQPYPTPYPGQVADIQPAPKELFVITFVPAALIPLQYDSPYEQANINGGVRLGFEFASGFRTELNVHYGHMKVIGVTTNSASIPSSSLFSQSTYHGFYSVQPSLRYTYKALPVLRPGLSAGAGITTATDGGTTGGTSTVFSYTFGGHLYFAMSEHFSLGPEVNLLTVYRNPFTEIAAGGLFSTFYATYLQTAMVLNISF